MTVDRAVWGARRLLGLLVPVRPERVNLKSLARICRNWQGRRLTMEKRYYTADTLQAELAVFEDRHGMSSAAFYTVYRDDAVPEEIDPFDAHAWVDTYVTVCRMTDTPRAELQPAG
jgi:hypothetical protein